eukprot:Sspe_Gene.33741::Locus_16450_Transcript_1_1_Confidence_1.000_Length_6022::g.33741::m.33741
MIPPVSVTNRDEDTAGVTVVPATPFTTTEAGGKTTVAIVLATAPTAAVTVPVTVAPTAEATCSPATLTFTTATWNTLQTVTITGVDDKVADGDSAFTVTVGTPTSTDPKYSSVSPQSVMGSNSDDDVAGYVISKVTLTTGEGGGTDQVDVSLKTQPVADVAIAVVSLNTLEGTAAPTSLLFTSSNWATPQRVVVTGVDDSKVDGDVSFTVELRTPTGSGDPKYKVLDPPDLSVTNTDNDVAEVKVTATLPLMTDEARSLKPSFTIELTSEPTAVVTVPISVSSGEGMTSVTSVSFNPTSWNSPITVVAVGVDDAIDDDDQSYFINLGPATSTDSNFDLKAASVPAINRDDDTAGVLVCGPDVTVVPCLSPLTVAEAGGIVQLNVRLLSEPVAGVTVTPTSSDTGEVQPGGAVTFTATNWNRWQPILLTGVDDTVDDGDQTVTVTLALMTADMKYAVLTLPLVSITNKDDETDECASQCPTCADKGAGNVCAMNVHGVCTDPDISDGSLGDWVCSCKAPGVGSDVKGGTPDCRVDECTANAHICITANQTCHDPNDSPLSLGDWVCRCVAPNVGADTVASVALCQYDECAQGIQRCPSGQTCIDTDPSSGALGNWECRCVPPTVGVGVTSPATCVLDECIAAPPCGAFQQCIDTDISPGSTGDWYCNCTAPFIGVQKGGPAPACKHDECAANTACPKPYQECVDPTPLASSMADWECRCLPPALGPPTVAGKAMCVLDECKTFWADVCLKAVHVSYGGQQPHFGSGFGHAYHQECVDPNHSTDSIGDWTCNCTWPAVGSASQGPAICTLDECLVNSAVCTGWNQTCRDPNTDPHDPLSEGDWVCDCLPPARYIPPPGIPYPTTQPVPCVINECDLLQTCSRAGQTCTDVNQSTASMGDWWCNCTAPFNGSARGAVADCILDECSTTRRCGVEQTCNDTDMSPMSLNDWECLCPPTLTPEGDACVFDECRGRQCGVGQECIDPNRNRTSLGDWFCRCTFPLLGDDRVGGSAYCTYDECLSPTPRCPPSQKCVDRDTRVDRNNTWDCVCVPPYQGPKRAGNRTVCSLDECSVHRTVCEDAGQLCVDPNVTTDGDWECRCSSPSTGPPGIGKAALCTVDPCAVAQNNQTCIRAGQRCVTTPPTWECECLPPWTGRGQPAVCTQDECDTNVAVCTSASQRCFDDDLTLPGTWGCECPPPMKGREYGKPALCTLDECLADGKRCTDVGQLCKDGPGTGDWECHCTPPMDGLPGLRRVAVCELNECQSPSASSACPPPYQRCLDPNKSPGSISDWVCVCVSPAEGPPSPTSRNTACSLNECSTSPCGVGQECIDPTPSTLLTGDWTCTCTPPLRGRAVGQPAVCDSQGECGQPEVKAVCSNAGQICEDPNVAIDGNWQCRCASPKDGVATLGPAACTEIGITQSGEVASAPDPWTGGAMLAVAIPLFVVCLCIILVVCWKHYKEDKRRQISYTYPPHDIGDRYHNLDGEEYVHEKKPPAAGRGSALHAIDV